MAEAAPLLSYYAISRKNSGQIRMSPRIRMCMLSLSPQWHTCYLVIAGRFLLNHLDFIDTKLSYDWLNKFQEKNPKNYLLKESRKVKSLATVAQLFKRYLGTRMPFYRKKGCRPRGWFKLESLRKTRRREWPGPPTHIFSKSRWKTGSWRFWFYILAIFYPAFQPPINPSNCLVSE